MLSPRSSLAARRRREAQALPQTTIATSVEASGVGLHSGRPATVRLAPVPNGGRWIQDLDGRGAGAAIGCVRNDTRATVIDLGSEAQVSTVEHLLAALAANGIDHVDIDVDGGEVPALDGSAAPFVALLAEARRVAAGGDDPLAWPFAVEEPIEVADGDRFVRAEPADVFGFRYEIDFEHPAIGRQAIEIPELTPEIFAADIAPARTFGFLKDLDALREAGLAGGASLDNTLVFDDTGVVNDGALRFPDECVRHKAIDLIGDLALLGALPRAFVTAHKAGHRLHHALVREIEARRSAQPAQPAQPA